MRLFPLVLAGLVVLAAPKATAANPDLIVSKLTDGFDGVCDQDCSLREALEQANRTSGATRIVLGPGRYTLSIAPPPDPDGNESHRDSDDNRDGDLDASARVTIVGLGRERTTITSDGLDRILEVLPGASVTLADLAIRDGRAPYGGGGLSVNAGGSLRLERSTVSGNLAGAAFSATPGGGILNLGTLTVISTLIEGNGSSAGEGSFGNGGGIHNEGSLTVRDSRFANNRASDDDDAGFGGGVLNSGSADIRRSVFERNQVSVNGAGAGIVNIGSGRLRMENVTVSGSDLDIDGNNIGAVENGSLFDAGVSVARLVNVTIAGNGIRGLINRGDITVLNSIISGNGLPAFPEFGEPAQPRNCTTSGPGSRFVQQGLLRGTDGSNCPTTLLVPNEDSFETLLSPLAANNNASLPSFSLPPGSIAIDAAVGTCASHDQRGSSRLRDGNGDGIAACDLGAYERPKP